MPEISKALRALMTPAFREAFQRAIRKPVMYFEDDLEPGFIRVEITCPPAEARQQIDGLAKAEIYPLSIDTTQDGTKVVFAVPKHLELV